MARPPVSRGFRHAPSVAAKHGGAGFQTLAGQTDHNRPPIKDQILAGALTAMGQRGLRKVSIEDICTASGLSRRTLYRHFDSREAIIAGVALHMREQFEADLARAILARPNLDDRVMVVMAHLTSYPLMHEATFKLVATELEFMRDSVTLAFDNYVEMIRVTVAPIFTAHPELTKAGLTDADLSELMMRFAMQALLSPTIDHTQATKTFSTYWRLVVKAALLDVSAK